MLIIRNTHMYCYLCRIVYEYDCFVVVQIDEPRSVRIAELPEEDEPQPSTSKDEDNISEPSEPT